MQLEMDRANSLATTLYLLLSLAIAVASGIQGRVLTGVFGGDSSSTFIHLLAAACFAFGGFYFVQVFSRDRKSVV